MASLANTARAVGLPSRCSSSSSLWRGLPSSLRFSRYDSESGGTGTTGWEGRRSVAVPGVGGASTDTR